MDLNLFTKRFLKVLKSIDRTKHDYEVFNDFVYLASYCLENVTARSPVIEEKYLARSKGYSKDQLLKFSELLGLLISAQENAYSDYLGSVYMSGELFNKGTGQYFTPFSIASMMNELQIDSMKEQLKEKPVISIQDGCCGSGVMLLANFSLLRKNGLNPQTQAFYHGQDIDPLVARMCFIQLSIIGAKAMVVIGDSLNIKNEASYTKLYTPMYTANIY